MRVGPAFFHLLKRDLCIAWRSPGELLNPLFFFILAALLFPLSMGPDVGLLKQVGNGVVWVCALLSGLLSLDNLFRSDQEDGSLEQWILSPVPAEILVVAKIFSHWLVTGFPIVLCSPLLLAMFHLPGQVFMVLLTVLFVGTLLFSLIGAVGAALTVGQRRNTMLLGLLIIPLYLPVLILGTASMNAAMISLPWMGYLLWLLALFVLALTLIPFAVSAALKVVLADT